MKKMIRKKFKLIFKIQIIKDNQNQPQLKIKKITEK